MSDEDDFMLSADEEDFDFGYEEDFDEENDIELDCSGASEEEADDPTNKYYSAKALKGENQAQALELFEDIIASTPSGELGIKARKQSLKMLAKQGHAGEVEKQFDNFVQQLVESTWVSQNYKEQSFLNIVEHLGQYESVQVSALYRVALSRLRDAKGYDKLAAKTGISLARVYVDKKDYAAASALLNELHEPLEPLSNEEGWKESMFLDLLALKMQIAMAKGTGEEEQLYRHSSRFKFHMVHPRTLAVIRECGGINAMKAQRWADAKSQLLKCFKHYDEAGLGDRIRALRYYVIAAILSSSGLNPFDSQETKAYRDEPELEATAHLVDAFLNLDVKRFPEVLKNYENTLAKDALLASVLPTLKDVFQKQALVKMVRPYSNVKYSFLTDLLDIDVNTFPEMLCQLILDGQLPTARLDDTRGILLLDNDPVQYNPQVVLGNQTSRPVSITLPQRFTTQWAAVEQERQEQEILHPSSPHASRKTDVHDPLQDVLKAHTLTYTRLYYP